jgi:hypothetical protein
MTTLRRTTRVICTVLVEAAALVALVLAGRRAELRIPLRHLGPWLRDGDPATVVVALLRGVALVGAGWLLASTLLYFAAAVSRAPAAMRAVRWSTLPAARRAIDAACAVSVATSVMLVPAVAGAARTGRDGSDTTSVSVRDGHGGIAQLPPDSTTTTLPRPQAAAPTVPAPPAPGAVDSVVVASGDNLWELAAVHLAATSARTRPEVSDAEIAPYWVRVCEANRDRLASGDVNLVFPGERVVLPPLS